MRHVSPFRSLSKTSNAASPPPRNASGSTRRNLLPVADVNSVADTEIPPHLKRCLNQLRHAADALEDTTRNLHHFTQPELFAADTKARVLVQSQRDTLRDLTFFCEREIRFLRSKIVDVTKNYNGGSLEPQPADRLKTGSECGWISLYGSVAAAARCCGASSAAVFAGSSDNALDLLALVRNREITALSCGVEQDVFSMCQSVVSLRCAVNIIATTPDRPASLHDRNQHAELSYQSLVAAPIFSPVNPSLVIGVVAMWNKIPVPGNPARGFSRQDEAAVELVSCQAGQIVSMFSLGSVGSCGAEKMSPLAWETLWCAGTHQPIVLCAAPMNPAPRRFVFRHDGERASTTMEQNEKEDTKVRHVIDSSHAFSDISTLAQQLQQDVDELRAQVEAQKFVVAESIEKSVTSKQEASTAVRCANMMRIANERLLRNTFVQRIPQDDTIVAAAAELVAPVQQGYTFIASPPLAVRDGARAAASLAGPQSAKRRVHLKR